MSIRHDLIVIGGGPAGMMAAVTAAGLGAGVLLLEKMPHPGRKLLMTGNGRCNLTNNLDPVRFIRNCGSKARFLRNALSLFSNDDTVRFFNEHGVTTRLENGHLYFPLPGGAVDVLCALERLLHENGVDVRTAVAVSDVRCAGGSFEVLTNAGQFASRNLVIATGGMSYPATGSDGSGYAMARALGHTVNAPRPGNVPLVLAESWFSELQGISLQDCRLSFMLEETTHVQTGGLLFTHFGLSGPAALDASRILAAALEHGMVAAWIDLLPGIDARKLDRQLISAAARFGKKKLKGLVSLLVPDRLAQAVVAKAGLRSDSPASQLGAGQRDSLVRTIKRFAVIIAGTRGFSEAMVTVGGVDTREVHPATMESKKMPGLFFCGEILDLDGPCGGYNLQIAWTTGYAAGIAAGSTCGHATGRAVAKADS